MRFEKLKPHKIKKNKPRSVLLNGMHKLIIKSSSLYEAFFKAVICKFGGNEPKQ